MVNLAVCGVNQNGQGKGDRECEENEKNRKEAMMALAVLGRLLESIPPDLVAAVKAGRTPAAFFNWYVELEKLSFFRWLLEFGGFKERLLADDLFLAKVGMECGVDAFTKRFALCLSYLAYIVLSVTLI